MNLDSVKKSRGIRADIRKSIEKQSCRILDTYSQIEIVQIALKQENAMMQQDLDTKKALL